MTYPQRLNKYLAEKGIASRRVADNFIAKGYITINGKVARLGDKVLEGDTVLISREVLESKDKWVYYLVHKPRGYVSTNPQYENERSIKDFFNPPEHVSVIGRLDKDSEGLLLLTNDGRVTHRLLSSEFKHEKEYKVKVTTPLKERVVRIFARGMNIEGEEVKGVKAHIVNEKTLTVILTEGKRHQIRRMLSAVGYEVAELKRTRIMNLTLGNLAAGTGRPLTPQEKNDFLKGIGLL
jgi:23S rRNA pseudouridine2604 synthase